MGNLVPVVGQMLLKVVPIRTGGLVLVRFAYPKNKFIKLNLNNKLFFFYKMTSITILSETTREFTFADDFTDDTCCITIKVIQKKYENENQYYDISYSYDVDSTNKAHPFHNLCKVNSKGTIVFKNELTDIMVKYLLLPDEELSKFSGTTTPKSYRKIIIKCLDSLWD